jgi:hypothetical protein
VPSEKELLQKRKAINWKEVDEYPSLLNDKLDNKHAQQCFFGFNRLDSRKVQH